LLGARKKLSSDFCENFVQRQAKDSRNLKLSPKFKHAVLRRCIFCDSRPLTLEHVWPQWIINGFTHVTSRMNRTGRKPISFPSDRFEIKVRATCRTCNNEWMSRLEEAAKPWLEPLIEGTDTTLHQDAQACVASWSTKTAMVLENTFSIPRHELYYRAEECAAFRTAPHIPPIETSVMLAAFNSPNVRTGWATAGPRNYQGLSRTGPIRRWSCATMMFGRLVIQVQSQRHKSETGNELMMWSPPHTMRAAQVWPIKAEAVRFPPGEALSFKELEEFGFEAPDPRV
jgi:hypothetical protein